MLTEDYVSFETAKLLKKKRFDIPCDNYYDSSGKTPNESVYGGAYIETLDYNADPFVKSGFFKFKTFSAPTQSIAMKWLREVHKIFIDVDYDSHEFKDSPYFSLITNMNTNDYFKGRGLPQEKSTYEEACEAAIKYCLENLI